MSGRFDLLLAVATALLPQWLVKLGPDNLEAVSTHPIDRRFAAAVPLLSTRWR